MLNKKLAFAVSLCYNMDKSGVLSRFFGVLGCAMLIEIS